MKVEYGSLAELLADEKFLRKVKKTILSYPKPETALIPCLHLCQKALDYVPEGFQEFIAEKLGFSPAHVRGVVTFYEMFKEKPRGKYLLQVCKTLPCMLAGSQKLLDHLERKLALKPGGTTQDKRFSLVTVECLACCDKGPALMVNDDLFLEVSPEKADSILEGLE